jgi:hypothetical protein
MEKGTVGVAGECRVAAPLLGGVRGWVYLNAATDTGITTKLFLDANTTVNGFLLGKCSNALIPT